MFSYSYLFIDEEPPTFVTAPTNITVVIDQKVIFEEWLEVTDNDEVSSLECTPQSGVFPLGTTKVMCIAKDPSGNKANHSLLVIVEGKLCGVVVNGSAVLNILCVPLYLKELY